MCILPTLSRGVGASWFAALYKANELNGQRARKVCSRVHLVHAFCRRRKVRRFGDYPELIHFSTDTKSGQLLWSSQTIHRTFIQWHLPTILVLVYVVLCCAGLWQKHPGPVPGRETKWASFEASALPELAPEKCLRVFVAERLLVPVMHQTC